MRRRAWACPWRLLVLLATGAPGFATTFPNHTGFVETVLTQELGSVTAAAVSPDGRIFVAEQAGSVRVLKAGVLLSEPFAVVPADAKNERGLLGITLHPDFPHTPFVYVYYSALGLGANRLSRFQADGDVALPDEEVLVELPSYLGSDIHMGGALHFGPDGMLYVAVGDHARSLEAQPLISIVGKLLRLDEHGGIPQDNPFYAQTTGLLRAIWARGLRNPFTFAFHPTTGRLLINDVGQADWEEIDEGLAGANYGWPESEGPTANPSFVSPLYAYSHLPPGSQGGGCAISGGAFYAPPVPIFPAEWVGRYLFADFCAQWIRFIDPNTPPPSGTAAPLFARDLAGRPVDLDVGPDGSLYVLGRLGEPPREDDVGIVTRITYTGTRAPQITVQPVSQTVFTGEPVTFVAGATDAATFQWRRDQDPIPGATGTSYTLPATGAEDDGAIFDVVVSNQFGDTTSNPAMLTVTDNHAPVPQIIVDAPRTLYRAGDRISFTGSATDLEDGAMGIESFTWSVSFHHDTHFHPVLLATPGVAGAEFTVPTMGETSANVWYRIALQVEDSGGRVGVAFADVHPEVGTLTLASVPSGLRVDLDGQPRVAPQVIQGVVGMLRTISTPASQALGGQSYTFHGWAPGGGPRTQVIAFPAGSTTMTAQFDGPPTTTVPTTTTSTTTIATTSTTTTSTTTSTAATSTTTTETTTSTTSTTTTASTTSTTSTTTTSVTGTTSTTTTSLTATSSTTTTTGTTATTTSTSPPPSTTSSTTTSTTTSSTTTSIPPPPCGGPCDDGDPCTSSSCVDNTCVHVPVAGPASVSCVCARPLPSACPQTALPSAVQRLLDATCTDLVRAPDDMRPAARRRLLDRSLKRWRTAARHAARAARRDLLAQACADALRTEADDALARIRAERQGITRARRSRRASGD